MSESAGKAVFLSYASQDAETALRISTALRAAGVEVWLDQEGGLVGGDTWDRKIREQITACTLFVPLVSANTQARKEGYFRLEWHLAEERVRLIAKGVPFIVPVSIDGTTERGALVPDAFLAVQWTKLPLRQAQNLRPADDGLAAFVARVGKLLGGSALESTVTARPFGDARGGLVPEPTSGPPLRPEVPAENLELPGLVRLPPEGALETAGPAGPDSAILPSRPAWRRALPFAVTAVAAFLVAGLVALILWPKATPPPVSRYTHVLPEEQTIRISDRQLIAVSTDGRAVVYVTTQGLALRKLGELQAHVIPGSEMNSSSPCFSPDGQSIAYSSRGTSLKPPQLKRIATSGGTPVVIDPGESAVGDVSWGRDDTILFTTGKGILRVPATGGTPVLVVAAQRGERFRAPQHLPDRDTVIFAVMADRTLRDAGRVVAQRISTGQRTVLVEGASDARLLSTGHLVYAVGNALMGVAFDSRRLVVSGRATQLLHGVMRTIRSGAAAYDVAEGGTLVFIYSALSATTDEWPLGLSDRAGKVTTLALPPGAYDTPRVSPDGARVAVGVADPKEDYIAIYDLDGRTALRRLTFGGNNRYPVWSRDSQRVTYQSDREGDRAIFWQRADGTDQAERLTKPEKDTAHVPASWSPMDETLLFSVDSVDSETIGAIRTYTRASGTVSPFGGVETATLGPVFSPDGRWVAYASGGEARGLDGGRKIYLQPYPATGIKYEVPAPPGANLMSHPFWAPDGTVLYYSPTILRFAAVPLTTQPTVAFGNPTELPRRFQSTAPSLPRGFDITPDGHFVGRITEETGAENKKPEIHIVLNWVEELKRLVPVK